MMHGQPHIKLFFIFNVHFILKMFLRKLLLVLNYLKCKLFRILRISTVAANPITLAPHFSRSLLLANMAFFTYIITTAVERLLYNNFMWYGIRPSLILRPSCVPEEVSVNNK